jgi:hypothetical protein
VPHAQQALVAPKNVREWNLPNVTIGIVHNPQPYVALVDGLAATASVMLEQAASPQPCQLATVEPQWNLSEDPAQ